MLELFKLFEFNSKKELRMRTYLGICNGFYILYIRHNIYISLLEECQRFAQNFLYHHGFSVGTYAIENLLTCYAPKTNFNE